MQQTLRHADLGTLADTLNEQHARKWDYIVPAKQINMKGGRLNIAAADEPVEGMKPNNHMDSQFAAKLGIDWRYYQRMRGEYTDLLDANVNGWLGRANKNFMVRGFRENGEEATGRALLGSNYKMMDNRDALYAALEAIRETGASIRVQEADLTERRMMVKVYCPDIARLAPELMRRYDEQGKVPMSRDHQAREWDVHKDTIFAGFIITNSETGEGAFSLHPRIVVRWCMNGAVYTEDGTRKAHLGARLDVGGINYSSATQDANKRLIASQTKDAVETFLSQNYLDAKVNELEEANGTELPEPVKAVETVGENLKFTEKQRESLLGHFTRQGDNTPFGVMQAVTSLAKELNTGDDQHEAERLGPKAFTEAMKLAQKIDQGATFAGLMEG